MPEEALYMILGTLLGGFLSAATGLFLFFVQSRKTRRDEDQNILYRIYLILKTRPGFYGRNIDGMIVSTIENRNLWIEVESLSLLLSDKDFGNEIYSCISKTPPDKDEIEIIGANIQKRLNKSVLK
jgi:hypothetical protein